MMVSERSTMDGLHVDTSCFTARRYGFRGTAKIPGSVAEKSFIFRPPRLRTKLSRSSQHRIIWGGIQPDHEEGEMGPAGGARRGDTGGTQGDTGGDRGHEVGAHKGGTQDVYRGHTGGTQGNQEGVGHTWGPGSPAP